MKIDSQLEVEYHLKMQVVTLLVYIMQFNSFAYFSSISNGPHRPLGGGGDAGPGTPRPGGESPRSPPALPNSLCVLIMNEGAPAIRRKDMTGPWTPQQRSPGPGYRHRQLEKHGGVG